MDFGLISYARGAIGRETLRGGTRALGTLSYVSPEQIQGRLVDARADLYSMGCMLFESLTGRPPFDDLREEALNRHLGERPRALSELVDGVPPALDALLMGLLAKQPQQRIGHADDVAGALAELLGESVQPAPGPYADTPAYLYRPQLAGREDVLRQLLQMWSQAEGGHGGLALIGGESGIGKTFLTAEFAQRTRKKGVRVVTGECVPVAATGVTVTEVVAGEPLHPLRPLFQALADLCRAGGPEVAQRLLGNRRTLLARYFPELAAPTLPSPPGEALEAGSLPAQAARERLLACLSETLAAFVAEGPLLLLLDDLQWADDLTIAFLASLPRSFFDSRRLLILGTYRSEEVGETLRALIEAEPVTGLVLERLDQRVVADIVRDMLAIQSPPPQLTAFLAEQSEGNPFFVAEYLRLLVAEGVLERSVGQWRVVGASESEQNYQTGSVPRSIQGLIARRLSRLDDASRRLIEAASVLGREFDAALLATIDGHDGDHVGATLREAAKRQVVEETEPGRFRFVHDKLRETAYAAIPAEQSRALHRAAAAVIEERHVAGPELSRYLPDLAHHWRRAGETAKAVHYLDRAGREALAKSANRDAITYFKEAIAQAASLASMETLPRARWHRQIADALHGLGRLEEAASHAREAAGLLGWPSSTRKTRLVLSLLGQLVRQVLHRLLPGRFLRSRRQETELLLEAARTHSRLQEGAYFRGDVPVMFHSSITMLNLTELADTSPELTSAYATAFAVAGVLPARKLAEAYHKQAMANLARHPDAEKESYLRMLAAVYRTGLGAWEAVGEELDRGQKLAEELRFSRRWEELSSVRSISSFLRGQLDRSLQGAAGVCNSAARGDLQTLCWGTAETATTLLAENNAREALARLRKIEPLLESKELGRTERLWVNAILARAALREGDRSLALHAVERAWKEVLAGPPISFAWIESYASVAEVFVQLWRQCGAPEARDRKRFERASRRVCSELAKMSRLFPVAEPCRWLWQGYVSWQLGKHARATAAWENSRARAQALGMPHDEALAMLALARGRSPGDPERTALLEQAGRIFERLGAYHGYELTRAP